MQTPGKPNGTPRLDKAIEDINGLRLAIQAQQAVIKSHALAIAALTAKLEAAQAPATIANNDTSKAAPCLSSFNKRAYMRAYMVRHRALKAQKRTSSPDPMR